jgi:hypothetical protein
MTSHPLHTGLQTALLCGALCLPAWAQTPDAAPAATAGASHSLTRMQRCQQELMGVEGAERVRSLRECLINRAEGERLIARDCSRQYRSLPAGQAKDKTAFQKQCVATGLQAAHKDLPGRKANDAVLSASKPVQNQEDKAAETKPPSE